MSWMRVMRVCGTFYFTGGFMAQYDGAIRIVTKITTKDAKESLSSLEYTIKKSAKEIDSLRSKMDVLKNQKIPTKEWKDLEKELSDSKNNLEKLIARQTEWENLGVTSGGAWDSLNEEIAKASDKVDLIKEKMQALTNAGKAFTLGKDAAEYKSYEKQIGYEEKAIAETGRHYKALLRTKDGYEKLKKVATSALQKIGSTAKKAAIAPFKMLGNTAKNAFSNIGKSAKKSSGPLSTLGSRFKGLALSLLIFNQISKAFNAMVSGMREGFSNLANENASFKNQVNGLKASLLTLKNSFAGAFAPIVQIAIPYIQQLIGWLTSAISAVGQFIAALTGRKTYIKAVKQTAGAFEDAAGAANDAKEAAEGYLSPLDEINKYSDGKDNGAGAGGGGGAGGAGQMFEEVPIESKFQNFVDKLKSFIKSEDWEDLGAFMASGINKGLQKIYDVINWDNVGPRITYFVNAFTRTFNSLVDNIDWDLLGRTIGAGINTIVNTLNLLIEGIDWINLGKSFAFGIMGIVSEVNWVNLGNLIGNKFMIAWKTFYGFVTNLDYAEIGLALANMVNGAIEKIDLGLIMASLSTFVIGLLEALSTAIQNTDWSAVGQQIADALRAIDWLGIASGLFDVGLQLINGLLEAFGELPLPVQIAAAAIGGFLAAFTITSVITGFIGAIQGVIEVIGGVVSVLGGPLTIAIVAIIAIGALLIANWDKIAAKAKEVWDFVKQKFQEFDTWLQNVFTHDWTKEFGIIGGVLNGFLKSVGDSWDAFKQMFNGIITFVKGVFSGNWRMAWEGVMQIFKGIWGGMAAILKAPINGMIGLINGMINAIVSGLNSAIRAFNRIRIPSWVPGIGGRGINISTISAPRIPYLATGTVVPPNREFMAVLGDNKREPEVVSPISTMKQAVKDAMSEMGGAGNSGTIIIKQYLDGKQIYETVINNGKVQQMSTGNNPFALGTT